MIWDDYLQKMVVSGIFAMNIEVRIAAQSPVIPAVPGVITPPLPPRCWPPRIEMAAANIRKSYRNLRPHFHRRQLMEGVGVLSTQYSVLTLLHLRYALWGFSWRLNFDMVCQPPLYVVSVTFLYASPRPICSLFIQNKCINALQCKSMRYIDNRYRSVQHFTPTGDTVRRW